MFGKRRPNSLVRLITGALIDSQGEPLIESFRNSWNAARRLAEPIQVTGGMARDGAGRQALVFRRD
jgi:hypothetical protein